MQKWGAKVFLLVLSQWMYVPFISQIIISLASPSRQFPEVQSWGPKLLHFPIKRLNSKNTPPTFTSYMYLSNRLQLKQSEPILKTVLGCEIY